MNGPGMLECSLTRLLARAELQGVELLTGHSGLDRHVYWLARASRLVELASMEKGFLVLVDDWSLFLGAGSGAIAALARKEIAGLACLWPRAEVAAFPPPLAEAETYGIAMLNLPKAIGYRQLSQLIAQASVLHDPRHGTPLEDQTQLSGISDKSTSPDTKPANLVSSLIHSNAKALLDTCASPELRAKPDWKEIEKVLRAYLDCGGNALLAGSALGIHRHTVRARLMNYEALTGLSLQDQDTRLMLELALRVDDKETNATDHSCA